MKTPQSSLSAARALGAFLLYKTRDEGLTAFAFGEQFTRSFGREFPQRAASFMDAERFFDLAQQSRSFIDFEGRFFEKTGRTLAEFVEEFFFSEPAAREAFLALMEADQSFFGFLRFFFGFRSGAAA